MPKNRGAEQGDVDGPLECSLASGMVAAETRGRIAARQAAGGFPWIGVNDTSEQQRLRADHATRLQESANFQLGDLEKRTGAHDPRHALQKKGGLADRWYMDDGDHVSPDLGAVFPEGSRRRQCQSLCRTEPTKNRSHILLERATHEWRVHEVQNVAKVSTVPEGSIALGVAVGPRQHIADQLLGQGGCHSSNARTRSAVPGLADRICSAAGKSWCQSHQPHTASARPHDPAGATSR